MWAPHGLGLNDGLTSQTHAALGTVILAQDNGENACPVPRRKAFVDRVGAQPRSLCRAAPDDVRVRLWLTVLFFGFEPIAKLRRSKETNQPPPNQNWFADVSRRRSEKLPVGRQQVPAAER